MIRSDLLKLILGLVLGAVCGLIILEPLARTLLPIAGDTFIADLLAGLAGALTGVLAVSLWQLINLHRLYLWIEGSRSAEGSRSVNGSKQVDSRPSVSESTGLIWRVQALLNRRDQAEKKRHSFHKKFARQARSAVASLPDAIVFINKAGKIQWANGNAHTLLGVSWPNDRDLNIVDIVRISELEELIESTARNSKSARQHDANSERVSAKSLDGIDVALTHHEHARYLNIKAIPYADELIMVVARDISRLVRASKIQTDFVANVSHELKTPLTVLKGYIEILGNQDDLSKSLDRLPSVIAQMSAQSERMELIVHDLLYLSSLENASTVKPDELVNVSALINTLVETVQADLDEKSLQCSVVVESKNNLLGNLGELHSAFANLLTNAILYSNSGGSITISWTDNESGACLSVKDTGSGIEPHHLSRITERFYRVDTDRSREGGGTGLGLAIVKHVLQRHDARLEISSELDLGSTFKCVFPKQRLR